VISTSSFSWTWKEPVQADEGRQLAGAPGGGFKVGGGLFAERGSIHVRIRMLGRHREALAAYNRVLAINPHDEQVQRMKKDLIRLLRESPE
jgi:hypothetical protein